MPKLIAAIIIGRNPEKYGFTDVKYHEPRQYETIKVPGGVDLEAVAVTANTSAKQLRSFNNELRKNQTPPKHEYTLRVPIGAKDLIAANLDKLRPVTRTVYATHTVKKGETLTTICGLYNINKTTLLKANNLRTAQLKKGLRLQIPTTSTKYVLLKEGEQPEELAVNKGAKSEKTLKAEKAEKTKPQMVTHRIKSGETVATVAKQYQVSVKDILQWNKIASLDKVKKGQQLSIQLNRPEPPVVAAVAKAVAAPAEKSAAQIPTLGASQKRSVAKTETVKQPAIVPSPKTVPVAKQSTTAPALVAKASKTPPAVKQSAAPAVVAKASKTAPAAKQSTTPAVVAKASNPPTWYVIKNGDTLTTIAQRFQTSAQDLRALNKLSGNTLQTGSKLLVKKG